MVLPFSQLCELAYALFLPTLDNSTSARSLGIVERNPFRLNGQA